MHIAVLGAGVVGVTTAYYLINAGHDVTILDRDADLAQGCSFANGAQLSYSYVDAMASPAFLIRMPGLLAGIDRAIRVRPPISLDLIKWGLAFVGECTEKKAAENTLANLVLARRSKQLLDELRPKLGGDFSYQKAGKLVLLRTAREMEDAKRIRELKAEFGSHVDILNMDQATEIEPGLAHMTAPYVGAVYAPGDAVGDAQAFTQALGEHLCHKTGCKFELGTSIDGLVVEKNKLQAIATEHGSLEADAVVVCLGSWSPALLKPLAIDVPICPARGYSVTLPTGPQATSVSVTDFGGRYVISRMGEQVRIAGFADFVGFNTSRDSQRVQRLLAVARANAPQAADYAAAPNHAWGGFRPLTPNGRPLIGATPVKGLYLNTGHGSLGWTLACASGEQVSSLISGQPAAALAA